jgi:hypothetical protein
MALFQPNPNPTTKELRWFAALWFPAFWGAVGLVLLRRGHPDVAATLWAAAAVLAIAGVASPAIIKPVFRGMMRASYPLGWLVSHAVVAAAYFLVITPIGLLMRIWHDPMRRRFEPSAKSYWIDCERVDRDRYFRQM